jgi:TonB family protein
MPDDSISKTEAVKGARPGRLTSAENVHRQSAATGSESDLVRLAALFAAHGGGRFSEQFSAELALEIVLNEIVEQACLTTGASGAAVFLLRDGDMVCRGSSGTAAPELGARLDGASGISGECIRSRSVQRCDDAESDPRADLEAGHRLGVRSAMLLPLLRDAQPVGIFEVLSVRPAAFAERDQLTLEALAHRIIENLERAEKPLNLSTAPPVVEHPLLSLTPVEPEDDSDDPAFSGIAGATERRVDVITWVLGIAVLVCAILVGARVALRSGWIPASAMSRSKAPSTAASAQGEGLLRKVEPRRDVGGLTSTVPASSTLGAGQHLAKGVTSSPPASSSKRADGGESVPPAGGLRVYENGVEVFRMNGKGESPDQDAESRIERSSSVEPERVVELPSSTAESSLLYRVEPDYPEQAREKQIEGPVVLQLHINRDGAVEEVKPVSGEALLAQAAGEAVKQWRFKPRAIHGRFVEMETTITLNFRLQR